MTRPIPGFPGYLATDVGQVLGKNGQPLRPRAHSRTGHERVRLYNSDLPPRTGGRYADVYVHVAVALAYHGPRPFPGAMVLHLDDNAHNNHPATLRWGTAKENAQHRDMGALEQADMVARARQVWGERVDAGGFDWQLGEQVAA